MTKIIFQNLTGRSIPRDYVVTFLKKYRRYLLSHLPFKKKTLLKKSKELIIVFTTDTKMRELNKSYRNRDYVTDILSFESEDSSSLGELALSLNKIRVQAREHRLKMHEELSYLLIHGVLHLLGYEHEKSRRAAQLMFKLQDEAFDHLSRPRARAKKLKKG